MHTLWSCVQNGLLTFTTKQAAKLPRHLYPRRGIGAGKPLSDVTHATATGRAATFNLTARYGIARTGHFTGKQRETFQDKTWTTFKLQFG